MHKLFFPGKRLDSLIKNISNRLKSETYLITGLPQIGLTSFLNYVEEEYAKITQDKKTIIISFEILPKSTSVFNISSKILGLMKYKLSSPKYLEELSCREAILEVIKRGRKILFLISRFQYLRNSPETMIFLQTLRATNSIKIRFFLSCDITCLTKPGLYKPAGILSSTNIHIFPPLTLSEIQASLKSYKKLYNWNIPNEFSEKIHKLSGGICGLTKYISKYIHDHKPKKLTIEDLLKDSAINYKVTEIHEKLKENELIKDNKFDLTKSRLLQELGVLDTKDNPKIKLLEYVMSDKEPDSTQVELKKLLSVQEFTLFNYLMENLERVVSLDDLSNTLWKQDGITKYSLWALYKTISNLNKKIKTFGFNIKNYRGRGYQLIKT